VFIHHPQGVFFNMYAKVTKFKNFVIFMFCNSSIDNKKQIIVNIHVHLLDKYSKILQNARYIYLDCFAALY